MKEKDISDLVRRYREVRSSGKSIYFDAEEFENLADYYDLMDEIDEAETVLKSGLLIHPDNESLKIKQARFMIYKGLYSQAMDFLNESFSSYEYDLYLLKIECFLNLGLYVEAIALSQKVIENEDEDLSSVFSELGFLYFDTDYINDAILYFEKSLDYNPENIEVLTELIYAYETTNDFQSAIKVSNRILDINPYSHEIWIGLGKLYSLCGEYEKAVDSFDFALVINESNDILKLKAHCLSLCDRIDEAIAIFRECIQNNPLDNSLYYSIAECYFSLEDYDNMLLYLDKCQELVCETVDILVKKAIAYLQKQDLEQTASLIKKAGQLDPENEDLHLVSGEYYFQTDNYILSENSFLKAYAKNKTNKTLLNRLSVISIAKGELSKSIEYLEALVMIEPENTEIKNRLVLLYFEVGDKKNFNKCLSSLDDEQLRYLITVFYDETVDSDSLDRQALINLLNDARECRQLYKNLMF